MLFYLSIIAKITQLDFLMSERTNDLRKIHVECFDADSGEMIYESLSRRSFHPKGDGLRFLYSCMDSVNRQITQQNKVLLIRFEILDVTIDGTQLTIDNPI